MSKFTYFLGNKRTDYILIPLPFILGQRATIEQLVLAFQRLLSYWLIIGKYTIIEWYDVTSYSLNVIFIRML